MADTISLKLWITKIEPKRILPFHLMNIQNGLKTFAIIYSNILSRMYFTGELPKLKNFSWKFFRL